MSTNRRKIPEKVSASVVYKNDRACCVCHKRLPFQINHINRNPTDNREENLCVLCLNHHNQFESKSTISKGLTPELLRKYKVEWEYIVRKRREKEYGGLHQVVYKKSNMDFIKSQIELVSYEIMSLPDNDEKRLKEKLDILWHINVMGGFSKEVITALHNIATIATLDNKNIPFLVADAVYDQFPHLIGPKEVKWSKEDEKNVREGITILKTIGEFNSEFNKNKKVTEAVCDNLYKLFEVAVWYNKSHIAKEIGNTWKSIMDASKEKRIQYNKAPFIFAINRLNNLKKSMSSLIIQYKRKWQIF